jgi:hypothetical protein
VIEEAKEADDRERQRRGDRHRDRRCPELAFHPLLHVAGQQAHERRQQDREPAPPDALETVEALGSAGRIARLVVAFHAADRVPLLPGSQPIAHRAVGLRLRAEDLDTPPCHSTAVPGYSAVVSVFGRRASHALGTGQRCLRASSLAGVAHSGYIPGRFGWV